MNKRRNIQRYDAGNFPELKRENSLTERHYWVQIRIKKNNLTHHHANADPRRRATSSEAPGACPGRVLRTHTQGRPGLGVLTSSLVSITGANTSTPRSSTPSRNGHRPALRSSLVPRKAPTNPRSWGKGVSQLPPGKLVFQSNKLFFKKKKIKFIYLFIWLHQILVIVCGIYSLTRNRIQAPSIWKCGVLATGPPGKSWTIFL